MKYSKLERVNSVDDVEHPIIREALKKTWTAVSGTSGRAAETKCDHGGNPLRRGSLCADVIVRFGIVSEASRFAHLTKKLRFRDNVLK